MSRTVGVKMYGGRLWLAAAALQTLVALSAAGHHRRSMPTQATLPVSKGGWRPVIGSSGLVYGTFGTAPLHAPPAYKVPIDQFASSARPLVTRDATKLTSIAQSYRPTTLRTVPSSQNPLNQPINSYHNPFANNNGLTYKYIQNFPGESVLIRNPHNPYAARPVFKYPQKLKQPIHNLQHLPNVQPVQFAYQTAKPFDVYSKPADFARPDNKKPQSSETEIFKPEVYKLPDNDVAQQALNQQVKTAQQQNLPVQNFAQNFGAQNYPAQTYHGQKYQANPYSHFTFQDNSFPPRIFGNFGAFNVQSIKGRDPVFPTRTTYVPQQPTRQTIFNSFSYSPNFNKHTPSQYPSTTPKLQSTVNHIHFGTAVTDFNKNVPTQPPKVSTAPKIDPNAGNKGGFKASPQDPFTKQYQSPDYNKVTTYNPVQTTTVGNYYNDFHYPVQQNQQQQNQQQQNYYDQQTVNQNYEKKKQKIHDSYAAGGNQEVSQQYINPPSNLDGTPPKSVPFRATYEVTETYSDDLNTHSSQAPWTATPESYDLNSQRAPEEPVTKQQYHDSAFKPETTPLPDVPEEFSIVTEGDKGYENSLIYDGQVDTQSRRPLGDDFEPIGKHKLKDYYYKVTPLYDEHSPPRRTKKPTEAYKQTTQAVTTSYSTTKANDENNELLVEPLPTLPPNRHFKRPSTPQPTEKEKARKRIKNRRRRPPLANINRNKEETSSATYVQSSTEPAATTEGEEYHSFTRRPTKYKGQPNLTTPSVTDDLTTSALPTISPTYPTIAKKKLGHRRPLTTTSERYETTTQSYRDYDSNKESPIMKIATRPQFPKLTSANYEQNSETPDYSHKQDEKDTPTSDIAVSLSDTLKTRPDNSFSFHRDVKPIETELEPVKTHRETTTLSLKDSSEVTTTPKVETTPEPPVKVNRPRLKNKYEINRPRFSVKDYRNRLSSTTSTTEKSIETHAPKVRFPQRRPYNENKFNSDNENATERKKFTPKDPRHKLGNGTEISEQADKEIHSRQSSRVRPTTVETTEGTTQKISSRIRNGSRRPRPTTEEAPETTSPTTVHKRLIRKKIKDSEIGESVQDVSVTETTVANDHKDDTTSERARSESAIMKIADKKHHDPIEHLFEHSKRVSDLTLAASKDYNTPGMFKTVAQSSRRVPNYFTIATDDPILPIEAFFPQLNQKKES